ncbi:MAG: hypothetical protein GY772_19800, partial [bacterium]|nr:hypothetical protein [bacterium]
SAAGFLAKGSPVQRLFRDGRAAEEDYFRRTSVFPIMHPLVLRRSVYEADPGLAQTLYRLFRDARDASLAQLRDADALHVMLPWLVNKMERVAALMGPDFWAYGVARNQRVLDAFLRYLQPPARRRARRAAAAREWRPPSLPRSRSRPTAPSAVP